MQTSRSITNEGSSSLHVIVMILAENSKQVSFQKISYSPFSSSNQRQFHITQTTKNDRIAKSVEKQFCPNSLYNYSIS